MTKECHILGQAEALMIQNEMDHETKLKMMSALSDEHVVSSKTLHEQIGWLCTLRRPNGVRVSYEKIDLLFNPSNLHATIKRHFEAFQKIPKEPKRPELLTEEQYQELASKLSYTRNISSISP